jgi:hypothetical protein
MRGEKRSASDWLPENQNERARKVNARKNALRKEKRTGLGM